MTSQNAIQLSDLVPNRLFGLSGQNAMVIGAGGSGKMAAIGLAAAGAKLSVADIDRNRADAAADLINQSGGHAAAYSASKGGVNQITIALAVDWADRGVRVNAVAPSYFETEIFTKAFDKDMETVLKERLNKVPMGRLGQPPELVGAIVFLASQASSMVTGAILPVDDGFLAA